MMAPGPSLRAPRASIWAAASPLPFPGVILKFLPSTKMLSLSAMVPGAFCAWAIAAVEKPAASPTATANKAREADRRLCIGPSCLIVEFRIQGLPDAGARALTVCALPRRHCLTSRSLLVVQLSSKDFLSLYCA